MSGFFDDQLSVGEIGFRVRCLIHGDLRPCLECERERGRNAPITGLPRYDDFCEHGVLLTDYCEPCEKKDNKDGLIG